MVNTMYLWKDTLDRYTALRNLATEELWEEVESGLYSTGGGDVPPCSFCELFENSIGSCDWCPFGACFGLCDNTGSHWDCLMKAAENCDLETFHGLCDTIIAIAEKHAGDDVIDHLISVMGREGEWEVVGMLKYIRDYHESH